jgi:hypothetical protein
MKYALPPAFTFVPSLLGLGAVVYGLLAGTLGLGLAAVSILIFTAGLAFGIAQLIAD